MSLTIEEMRLRCMEACAEGSDGIDHMIHRAGAALFWVMNGQTIDQARQESLDMMDAIMRARQTTDVEVGALSGEAGK